MHPNTVHDRAARDLRLEWCGALQHVNLASRSLRHVSLAGCARVQSLELACPSLTTLNLDECSELCRCAPALPIMSYHAKCRSTALRKDASRLSALCRALRYLCPPMSSLNSNNGRAESAHGGPSAHLVAVGLLIARCHQRTSCTRAERTWDRST